MIDARVMAIPYEQLHFRQSRKSEISTFRRRERINQERFFFSKEWLQQEVHKEAKKKPTKGEVPWYYLAGTGFLIKEQVSQLIRNVPEVGSELFPDLLERELDKATIDILAFEDEYLKQMLTLRYHLAWGTENGEKKVICPDYHGQTWESVTDKNERNGAVYDVLFGNKEQGTTGVEEWLKTAPPDSFALIVSPEGWSGIKDAEGNNIRFPETQVYSIRVTETGDLQVYTLRYKANIFENIAFLNKLGVQVPEATNQIQLIQQVLKSPILIKGDAPERVVQSFDDVVNAMQQSVNGREEAYEGKSFDEIRRFLAHPDAFSQRHPATIPLVHRFKEYVRWEYKQKHTREDREKSLQIALAVTILQLNKLYREEDKYYQSRESHGNPSTKFNKTPVYDTNAAAAFFAQSKMNYTNEKNDLQERPGCAGGGSSRVNSMGGTSRKGESTSSSEDYDFDHEGTCVVCNSGPTSLGPCDICRSCDAHMGGKAAYD